MKVKVLLHEFLASLLLSQVKLDSEYFAGVLRLLVEEVDHILDITLLTR